MNACFDRKGAAMEALLGALNFTITPRAWEMIFLWFLRCQDVGDLPG